MTITAEQREARRQWVGASDVAAICGLDPYRTAYDVWLEKRHRTEDIKSEAAELGDWLEPTLCAWIKECLRKDGGALLIKESDTVHHPELPLAFNPDIWGELSGKEWVGEAKTAGFCNEMFRASQQGWLPDTPPERVIIQVHAQMMCVGPDCRTAYVAALVAGMGRKLYTVERNDEWCDGIAKIVAEFWKRVEDGTPPDDTPTLDVCKRIIREPGKTTPVPADLVTEYEASTALEKNAKRDRETAKARLLASLGDAEAGLFEREGERLMVTNYADKRGARRIRIERNGNL